MPFPTSTNALGVALQDSDGPVVEVYSVPSSNPRTHQLGVATRTWPVAPTGGVAISAPGAPTAGAAVTDASFGLASSGAYKWALTNVTAYGETMAGTVLTVANIGSGKTGQTLNLPSPSQGTADVPITSRRLYRSINGGTTLYLAAELLDAGQTTWVDGVPDDALGPASPGSNSSGLASSVVLTGASTTWVEMPPGTSQGALTVGQYTLDYSLDPTLCGTITHATADAGKSVTATYTAATVLTSRVLGDVVTAQKDTATILGSTVAGAFASAGARMTGIEAALALLPVRQIRVKSVTADVYIDSSHQSNPGSINVPDYAVLTQLTLSGVQAGNAILVLAFGWPFHWLPTTGDWMRLGLALHIPAGWSFVQGRSYFSTTTVGPVAFPQPAALAAIFSAGSTTDYDCSLLAQAGGPGGVTQSAGFACNSHGDVSPLLLIAAELVGIGPFS